MIMIRLLLGFFIFWFLFKALGSLLRWFVIYKLNNLTKSAFTQNPFAAHFNKEEPKTVDDQPLVPCAQCGIYIIKSEAIERGNHYYCSKKHLP